MPAPPTGVDEPAQAAEEVWRALDLVEDDERVLVLCQVEFRLREFGPVGLGLQVEVDRRPRAGHFEREGGLPNLPRPQQGGGRRFIEGGGERAEKAALYHPCNYGVSFQTCKAPARPTSMTDHLTGAGFDRRYRETGSWP